MIIVFLIYVYRYLYNNHTKYTSIFSSRFFPGSFPLCLLCFITFSFIFFNIKEVKGGPRMQPSVHVVNFVFTPIQ